MVIGDGPGHLRGPPGVTPRGKVLFLAMIFRKGSGVVHDILRISL